MQSQFSHCKDEMVLRFHRFVNKVEHLIVEQINLNHMSSHPWSVCRLVKRKETTQEVKKKEKKN